MAEFYAVAAPLLKLFILEADRNTEDKLKRYLGTDWGLLSSPSQEMERIARRVTTPQQFADLVYAILKAIEDRDRSQMPGLHKALESLGSKMLEDLRKRR